MDNIYLIDSKVYKLYKKTIFKRKLLNIYLIDANENSKTLEQVTLIYSKLIRSKMKKKSLIIAMGGGIVQDIAGFVASTYYRGLDWIYVPTTLLAQADSCIGSKTSINFNNSKNLIGTFYPPSVVYINSNFINTLSDKDRDSGLGEIIKIQLTNINISKLLTLVDKIDKIKNKINNKDLLKIVISSLLIKKTFIEKDEFDKGIRNLLNYGHTVGHGIESTSNFQVSHGTAILIGIIIANIISVKRNILSKSVFNQINNKLLFPNIDSKYIMKHYFTTSNLFDKVKFDKKRTNDNLSFVIPNSALKLCKVDDVSKDELIYALNFFNEAILPLILI